MDKATGANRKVPNPVLIAGGVLVVVVAFWVWYVVAADYGYGALSGTYILQSGPETSTLILRENRTFEQQQSHMGRVERVRGTWRRVGEAGIAFSHEFLNTQQQKPWARPRSVWWSREETPRIDSLYRAGSRRLE
jgi:hypothetical protein